MPPTPSDPVRLLMGFYFFPRGGSAYVARHLARHLPAAGTQVRLITGSVRGTEEHTQAAKFFADVDDLTCVDYTGAVDAWHDGQDPLRHTPPMHASYEDRDGAPDRVLGRVSPAVWAHQERYWRAALARVDARRADVLHLHHLTPQLAPALDTGRPVLVHLHGTELKFLDACRTPSGVRWPHRDWAARFEPLLRHAAAVVAVSPGEAALATELLHVPADRLHVIPNGVDIERFDARERSAERRRAVWRRFLVSEPRGWDESGIVGSLRYTDGDLDRLFPPHGERRVLLCATRFLGFKRLPLLLESFARIRDRVPPTTLVVWGGFPGECEGEHPVAVARALGLDNVVFTGFRGPADLVEGFNAADLLVNAARHEPFGQLLIEAMATGLPVVAAASGGPASFVRSDGDQPTGWLFDPGDDRTLGRCLVAALRGRAELNRRGTRARSYVRERLAWQRVAPAFTHLYRTLLRQAHSTT
jgi:glycosyltransferase involved in cell wall biosynthesis